MQFHFVVYQFISFFFSVLEKLIFHLQINLCETGIVLSEEGNDLFPNRENNPGYLTETHGSIYVPMHFS